MIKEKANLCLMTTPLLVPKTQLLTKIVILNIIFCANYQIVVIKLIYFVIASSSLQNSINKRDF